MAATGFKSFNGPITPDDDFSYINSRTLSYNNELVGVNNGHAMQCDAEIGQYPAPDLDSLIDEVQNEQPDPDTDSDLDSDFEDVVVRSRKRKRATNNSAAIELEDGDEDFMVPTPAKRLQYGIEDKGILIGVWKNSPEPNPVRKHAVYGYLAKNGSLRRKVYPETTSGLDLLTECSSHCITHEDVILEPHLASMTSLQVKEFIELRSAARYLNETPDDKRQADSLAVQEVLRNTVKRSGANSTTAARVNSPTQAKPQVRYASISDVRGVLIGYWKNSHSLLEADKQAAYAVADGPRMRIKVSHFTRDGKRCVRSASGDLWIAYENVVREPALANLTKSEVCEYVRLRESERKNGDLTAGVDLLILEKARSNVAADARAKGLSVNQLDATTEQMHRSNNEKQKKRDSTFTGADLNNEAGVGNSAPDQGSSAGGPTTNRLRDAGSFETSIVTSALPVHAKAIRSSKAESDARAERKRRAKQAIENSHADLNRNLPVIKNGNALNEAEIQTMRREEQAQTQNYEEKLAAVRLKQRQEHQARGPRDMEARRLSKGEMEKAATKHQEAVIGKTSSASPAATIPITAIVADRQQPLTQERKDAHKTEIAGVHLVITREIETAARTLEGKNTAAEMVELAEEREAAKNTETARKSNEEAKERDFAVRKVAAYPQTFQDQKEKASRIKRSEHATAGANHESLISSQHQANLLPNENRSEGSQPISTVSLVPVTTINSVYPCSDVKWHNGVQYERKRVGQFAGNLVSKGPQVLYNDEEDYLEYSILIPWPSSSYVSLNGRTYARRSNPPQYPFSSDKLVSPPEHLTIDGEDYLEYRVLK